MDSIQSPYRHFAVTLQTLAPLHIGTGAELMKDIDFIDDGKTTYRLDVERILMDLWQPENGTVHPAQLLRSIPREEWGRYVVHTARGAIRAQRVSSKLRECIKTPDYAPYIPGSSLKGALRTALAWAGWPERIPNGVQHNDIESRKSWAGQKLEDRLFRPARDRGDGPNKDLLRALHVGDLHVQNPPANWQVLNVQVAKSRDFDSPIEVEAVAPETRFAGRMTVDEYMFLPASEAVLRLGALKSWLDQLAARVNQHALHLLERRIARAERMSQSGSANLKQFFVGLRDAIGGLPADQCVLCLGWGGGWDNKTFSSRLQADKVFFEREVIERFRLNRGRAARQPGDPFPRTQRVAVRPNGDDMTIRGVMGWCMLQLSPEQT